jgi:thiol-disulfide isomerase/thioredoxin
MKRPDLAARLSSPARRPAAGLTLILLALLAAGASAQTTFLPGGDLDLWVTNKLDPAARIYESQAEAAVLVVSDRLPTPVLLHVRSGGVQAVPRERLTESNGALTLGRGEPLQDLGKFEVVATDVSFWHGDVGGVLRPKASLVGAHTLAELYKHTPKYKLDAAAYQPDAAVIAKLRGVGADYHVKFVFGSWCSVCKQYLPRGLAVVEALAGAAMQFEYLGVPLEDPWSKPEVKSLGVTSLPTAIVYRGDKEIGRFAGAEQFNRPELRMWEAIERAQGASSASPAAKN